MKLQVIIRINCILLILFQLIYIGIHYTALPDIIPIHFGADGKPNGFGRKLFLWLLPAIEIIVSVLISFTFTKRVDQFKMNHPVNEAHKPAVRRFTRIWASLILLLVIFSFSYIVIGNIQVALGEAATIHPVPIAIFVVGILVLVFGGIFMLQEINAGRKKF